MVPINVAMNGVLLYLIPFHIFYVFIFIEDRFERRQVLCTEFSHYGAPHFKQKRPRIIELMHRFPPLLWFQAASVDNETPYQYLQSDSCHQTHHNITARHFSTTSPRSTIFKGYSSNTRIIHLSSACKHVLYVFMYKKCVYIINVM